MLQPSDRSSHKLHKRQQLLDQLLETTRGPVPVKDIEMATVIGRTTTGATTTTVAWMTIAATTTTVVTMIMIGRMIIVVTSIATTITPTDGTQEITKGTTGRKTYARCQNQEKR